MGEQDTAFLGNNKDSEIITKQYKSPKFALVIDGTYLFRRQRGASGLTFKNERADIVTFVNDLATVLAAEVRRYKPFVNTIIFTSDKHSWRKQTDVVRPLEMDTLYPELGAGYKANRVLDDEINWTGYNKACGMFIDAISEKLNVIERSGAEGDDTMAVVSQLLAKNNIKTMLWTSDGDMLQCISEHTALMRISTKGRRTLCLSDYMSRFYGRHLNAFKNNGYVGDASNGILSDPTSVEIVNPAESIFKKIYAGDEKDNVPPLFKYEVKRKDGKVTKNNPTATFAKKTLKKMGIETLTFDHFYDNEFIEKFCAGMLECANLTETETTVNECSKIGHKLPLSRQLKHTIDVFVSNRRLLLLKPSEIPKTVVESILNGIGDTLRKKIDYDGLSRKESIVSGIDISGITANAPNIADTAQETKPMNDYEVDQASKEADALMDELF